MRWTLEQLRALVAVADASSMTRAAAALGYTTGAISQQIAALEQTAGRRLLIRGSRGVELTDAGTSLLPHAVAMLDAEGAARQALTRQADFREIQVRLGVFGSIAVSALGHVTERLAKTAPAIRLHATEVDVESMPESVLDGRIDLALGLNYPLAPYPPRRGLESVVLGTERFFIVAPAGATRPVDSDELRRIANRTSWILPPASSFFGRAVRVVCGLSGIEPIEEHLVTDTAVTLALVEAGYGLTLASPLMTELRPSRTAIWELPVPADREIVALSRRSASARESVQAVQGALREAFAFLT